MVYLRQRHAQLLPIRLRFVFVARSHRLDFSSGQHKVLLTILEGELNASTMQRLVDMRKLFKGWCYFILFHPGIDRLVPEWKVLEHLYLRDAVSIAQHFEECPKVYGAGRIQHVTIRGRLLTGSAVFVSMPSLWVDNPLSGHLAG